MDLTTYERLIKTENAARKYLLGFCFENHQRYCPRCKGKKLYRLADDRRRVYRKFLFSLSHQEDPSTLAGCRDSVAGSVCPTSISRAIHSR